MKPDQVIESIRTGRLQLSFWDKFSHYWPVAILFCISLPFLYFSLKDVMFGEYQSIPIPILLFIVVPFILGIAAQLLQSRRLRFTSIKTKLTNEELKAIISETGQVEGWTLHATGNNFIVAKARPSLLLFSWGEQVTVLFDNGRVLVNSICDPDKLSSLTSFGRNKRHVRAIVEKVKEAEMAVKVH